MYIFKYRNKITNEIIGYHLSTFCQLGEKEKAKRYTCPDGWEDTRDTILRNVKYIISGYKEKKENPLAQIFRELSDNVYETYYKGLTEDDIDVEAEYVVEDLDEEDIKYRVTIIDPENNATFSQSIEGPEELVSFIHNAIKEKISQKLN